MAGGQDAVGFPTKTLFVYNPKRNNWTRRADLPVAAEGGSSAAINGRLFMCTPGLHGAPPRLHHYNPATDKWTELAAPLHNHRHGTAGAINGKFYVAGGIDSGSLDGSPTLDEYDPATNSWTTKAPMPTPRFGMGGGVISDKLYVVGGKLTALNDASIMAAAEAYNPATDTWEAKASMPTPRVFLAATAVDGVLFAVGGENAAGPRLSTNEAYTP